MNETRQPRRGPDPVEELLARQAHLDDVGFTDRVMGALPGSPSPWRWFPVALGAAAAAAVAAWMLPGTLETAGEALRGWRRDQAPFPAGALGAAATVAALALGWVSMALWE